MTALIEHADCVLWEAEVDVGPKGWWEWRMTIHPSVFARKLFRGVLPVPGGDLWAQFQIGQIRRPDERSQVIGEAIGNVAPV